MISTFKKAPTSELVLVVGAGILTGRVVTVRARYLPKTRTFQLHFPWARMCSLYLNMLNDYESNNIYFMPSICSMSIVSPS
jgi:uncharacterized membrane protein